MIEHLRVPANGVTLHVARAGTGRPLLLLHGWPEFWLTWEPVMQRLAGRFQVIAPDLRGFGESDKPDGDTPSDKAGPAVHAADIAALSRALGLSRCGVVAHDVGAWVAQGLARSEAAQLAGLFFFDCPYPGIGARWSVPGHLREIWYQSFHQMPMAASLVGASRETCRTYFAHFLRHWSRRPEVFEPVLEAWVDNFLSPGNIQGGFNWYVSVNAERLAAMAGQAPVLAPITVPTCVRWGDSTVLPAQWGDRLGESFTDLDFAEFPGVGHFPHREDPDRAAAEIGAFFDRVWPAG